MGEILPGMVTRVRLLLLLPNANQTPCKKSQFTDTTKYSDRPYPPPISDAFVNKERVFFLHFTNNSTLQFIGK